MRYFLYCRKSQEAEDRQVLSLPAQRAEAERRFTAEAGTSIVAVFEEAMSAKAPGRPIFNDMMARVEAGEADGIIAWAPDRLARNSMDGGRIVYLIDQGVIRDLKFLTYTFENNPQGKFMLAIMFGQSKYYSDALSENVKRGNRAKLERGWRPNFAPFGYLNDPLSKTIVVDPVHGPLIRRMFELALVGTSSRQIARIARDEWGFRSHVRKRIGGTPIGTSTVHRILTNPFYAGTIWWAGETYRGSHEALVSWSDFQAVGKALARPGREQPKRHRFAYTGLMRCACGLTVTAEWKTNRHGRRYLYYHCARRMIGPRCREPAIQVQALEAQVIAFLGRIQLEPTFEEWLERELSASENELRERAKIVEISLNRSISMVSSELRELTSLRTRRLIGDDEFVAERDRLNGEVQDLKSRLALAGTPEQFTPLRELISFSVLAVNWFRTGDDETRRLVFQTACSNPVLVDKVLKVEAAKPFVELSDFAACLRVRGDEDSFRTPSPKRNGAGSKLTAAQIAKLEAIAAMLLKPEYAHIVGGFRALRARTQGDALHVGKRDRGLEEGDATAGPVQQAA